MTKINKTLEKIKSEGHDVHTSRESCRFCLRAELAKELQGQVNESFFARDNRLIAEIEKLDRYKFLTDQNEGELFLKFDDVIKLIKKGEK